MDYLRVIKYPGSKKSLLPDIRETYAGSGSGLFVDVFGGSGLVSLNMNASRIVYNDLNRELVNLFAMVKENPAFMKESLERLLDVPAKYAGPGQEPVEAEDSPAYYIMRRKARARNSQLLDRKSLSFLREGGTKKASGREIRAFETLYRFSTSFGGMGNTYGTAKEKSSYIYLEKTLHDFRKIASCVRRWKIENLDFREVIAKYDGEGTFFYLDPPYQGKDWYDMTFTRDDYIDMKHLMDSMKGKYLLNVGVDNSNVSGIFGQPSRVVEYGQRNQSSGGDNRTSGKIGFFMNFQKL
ncbi:MAG: DNA adenine methylase [Thermoplasmataceae archaeon]